MKKNLPGLKTISNIPSGEYPNNSSSLSIAPTIFSKVIAQIEQKNRRN